MKLTEQLQKEILKVYEAFWGSLLNVDLGVYDSVLDVDYRMIGTTENEVFYNKQEAIRFLKATAEQLAGNLERRESKIKLEAVDRLVLITEQFVAYVLIDRDWTFYGKTRVSTWLQLQPQGWKIVQQHFSLPDTKAEEGQTIGLEKIAKENLELRDAIKRRTVELESKNRELEIEAALDRVRNRTLLMKDSSELNEAVAVFFQQLKTLNLLPTNARTYFCDINADTAIAKVWMTHSDGTVMQGSHQTPLTNSLSMINYFEAWKRKEPILERNYTEETLAEYLKFLASLPHVQEDTDYQKLLQSPPPQIVMTDANFLQGNIGVMSFEPLSKEALTIMVRFAKLFEFTYTRFLDLQKAETQAKEAQIELGLERVRTKAMAMRDSDGLDEMIGSVLIELTKLDLVLTRCIIMIFEPGTTATRWWMANSEAPSAPMNFLVQAHENAPYQAFIQAWKDKTIRWQYDLQGKDKRDWDDFIFGKTELSRLPDFIIAGMKAPERVFLSASFNNFGCLNVASLEPLSHEHFDILLRFAKVFDLTYTRYNDLKQAEAQAKEAQIEAALERVRSRTMAMQRSEELLDVASILFQQVKALGVPQWNCGFNIWDLGDKEFIYYPGAPDGIISESPCTIPLTEHPIFRKFDESRRRGDELLIYEKEGEIQKEHYQYMLSLPGVGDLLQSMLDAGFVFPSFQIDHVANFAYGNLIFITYEHFPEMHEVFKRFAKVFEQTYTRFLDLQKAEAQAREAEIQLGLERVRARTMAMQHSDELIETSELMFEQIKNLGIELWSCGFSLWYEEDSYFLGYNPGPDGKMGTPLRIPLTEDLFFKTIREAKRKGEEFLVFESGGESLKQTYRYMDTLPVVGETMRGFVEAGFPLPQYQVTHCGFFSEGHLMFITHEPNPKAIDIFKRFTNVFDQTYTRFLDLQKAEAQAKEAQIEAALERVRSRTMGMQASEELAEVAFVLFQQLRTLGGNLWGTGFGLCEKDSNQDSFWFANENGVLPPVSIPNTTDPVHKQMFEGWMAGKDFLVVEGSGKELENHYDYLISLPEVRRFFQKIIDEGLSFPEWQQWNAAYFRQGYLLIITLEPYPDSDILKRFAKVFEQTYTRFLDLQKAEAQAKEAQIEAALERVRSTSLAMHKAEELENVVAVVFQKLKELGLTFDVAGIQLYAEGSKDIVQWVAAPDLLSAPSLVHLPFVEKDLRESEIVRDYWAAKDTGKSFCNRNYSFDEKNKFFGYAGRHNDLTTMPEEVREFQLKAPGYTQTLIAEKRSALWVDSYSGQTIPNEGFDILNRFARVFEQAYIRFLDLQKAEDQAREAKIESALERVRSRSMAMHKSEELLEAGEILFLEMQKLGIESLTAGYVLLDIEGKNGLNYTPHPGTKKIMSVPVIIPHNETIAMQQVVENWKKGISFFIVEMDEEETIKHQTFIAERSINFPLSAAQLIAISPPKLFLHNFYFKEGYVLIVGGTKLSAEQTDIMLRFAKVFQQTYTRFLDLQKAEAQAREAQVEVALERIRARALAMQSSTELNEVAKVLRDQMGILDQEDLEASVVHLYSADSPTFDSWYAFRAGDKILEGQATFRLENSALAKEFLKLYEDDITEYTIEVKGQKLKEWLAEIKRNAPKIAAYWGDLPPEKQFYHFSDFSGGALLMVSHENPTEETRMLQKRCALVFELAYKRFLDLESKEKQERELLQEKLRLEQALSELKATQAQLIQAEKMASLGELTAGIAHEIQNPLNFVNNFSEVSAELVEEIQEARTKNQDKIDIELENEILEDIKQNLEKITLHGKRADAIVKGMLEHSKRGSGQKQETDINALADEFLRMIYQSFLSKDANFKVELQTNLDPDLPKISVIPQDIGKVLLNLYSNAFYACATPQPPEGGGSKTPTVTLSTSTYTPLEGGRGVKISVKDNGSGIPQNIVDKIFQPFFTTKPTGSGTGLGLSLSYDIVKAHGGELKVVTEEGKGSEFIIQIPINTNIG